MFDAHQGTLKEKHSYWPILELILRLITMAFSVLNKQLSVLLNTIVIIMFVCCLGIVSPFRDIKTHLLNAPLLSIWFVFSYVHLTMETAKQQIITYLLIL